MRYDRCVAHLTYGAAPPDESDILRQMGQWVYGCDVCQDVCPLNNGKWEPLEPAPWLEEAAHLLTPEALSGMDEATYREVVNPRFWYLGEDGLDRWRTNARRALRNRGG